MRDEKEASKVKQTNKAKQHSTPKACTSRPSQPLRELGVGSCGYHGYVHVHLHRPIYCSQPLREFRVVVHRFYHVHVHTSTV